PKDLLASEINAAENIWIRSIQNVSFPSEIEYLSSKSQGSIPNRVRQFGLFIDEQELLRCEGRIDKANIPRESKNPMLLPAKHPIIDLIVRDVHHRVKHNGIRDTLTTTRERFWILRGREVVKRILKKCVVCRKAEGTPYGVPPPPHLPPCRVADDPPFTNVGLDFAGPLLVRPDKEAQSSIESLLKVYVLLFTCASTRGVHLELTPSLSVSSFLQAFRRFASRRGLPSLLVSDNAKTYKSASKEIRNLSRAEEVWRYLSNNRITWQFIVEKAPWWGGFWERLVRSIKRPLKKVIGRASLTYEELSTLVVEIEGLINSRPLTYVFDDDETCTSPLCPSHLIYGRRITTMPNSQHYEVISTYQSLTKRARHHRNLIQQFTKQWRTEYLLGLREQSRVMARNNKTGNISIGDIVILRNDKTSRCFWKLAKVEQLLHGEDNLVRAAVVKVLGGKSNKAQLLRRSISHLIPIEVKQPLSEVKNKSEATISEPPVSLNTRPRRMAAVIGELKRAEQLKHI
ncbi:RNA-directed DNA polymerase from mobile element jockey, partial [Paramuricea clavata]